MCCLTLIAELHAGNNFDTAFETVVGWDLATYDIRWRESLAERYRWAIPLFQFLFFSGGDLAVSHSWATSSVGIVDSGTSINSHNRKIL